MRSNSGVGSTHVISDCHGLAPGLAPWVGAGRDNVKRLRRRDATGSSRGASLLGCRTKAQTKEIVIESMKLQPDKPVVSTRTKSTSNRTFGD
jgi:hypothetical protein